MKSSWLCFVAGGVGSGDDLSIMMEMVCSPQVIWSTSQRPKDLKFPTGMHLCKSTSQAGHLIVRLQKWHDKLFLLPIMNESSPQKCKSRQKSWASYTGGFILFTVFFFGLIFVQYLNTYRLLFLNCRLLFFHKVSNPAGIDFLDSSATSNSHSHVHWQAFRRA